MRMRSEQGGRDQGAAAIEFALLMPVLFALLTGILEYGMWFSDSLSVRQGVRESARQAVVRTTATGCSGTGMAAVNCGTRSQMSTATGVAYAMAWAPSGWVQGQQMVVCGMVKASSFTGFVPLPAGGLIRSKTTMSIESVSQPPSDTNVADTPPAGGDWSWCTA